MSDELTDEIRYFGDVQRLALQPGDIVVLSTSEPLSEAAYARISATMRGFFPKHRVLILDKGMQLGVLSPSGQGLI